MAFIICQGLFVESVGGSEIPIAILRRLLHLMEEGNGGFSL